MACRWDLGEGQGADPDRVMLRWACMHPAFRHPIPLAPVLAPLLALLGCSRDHSLLAADPDITSAASAASGTGGGGGGGGGEGGAAGGGGGAGGAAPVVEPPGPTRLTLVNGIVDYDAVRICFLPYPDSGQPAMPWPSDAA